MLQTSSEKENNVRFLICSRMLLLLPQPWCKAGASLPCFPIKAGKILNDTMSFYTIQRKPKKAESEVPPLPCYVGGEAIASLRLS